MVNLAVSAAQLLLALFLVVLNGFFVASEFAFVRIRSTSVEQLVEEGKSGSDTLQDVVANLDDYLAVTQLGITIASLGLGWVGEPAVASLIEPILGSILPAGVVHLVAFAIGFGVITFLHVVFGELAPKTFAIARAERISLFVAPPMKFFYYVFYPGLVVFNGTANAFTGLLGVTPASETDETLEEREIRRVLARASEEGNIDTAEVEMIEGVFDLDDTLVREIMVPRPDVVSIPADASLATLRSTVLDAGHTRYPVVEPDNADQVVGFVDVKDVLQAIDSEEPVTTGDLAREINVTPETTTISDLLVQFRDDRQQMAVVIDEWGVFEGIVTVEDVVEGIVGDLRDGFDQGEPTIRRRDGGEYHVDGGVALSTVSDALDVELRSERYETIGGLVLGRLDRMPEPDDEIVVDGYTIRVMTVDGTRISTLRIDEADTDDEEENTE